MADSYCTTGAEVEVLTTRKGVKKREKVETVRWKEEVEGKKTY
jgi:hypothetical protein